jgi:Ca2+-binding EF-hand superfamily protein
MSAAAAAGALQLSATERAAYDELFALADADNDGQVSVAEVAFLRKSGLDNTQLSQVT